MLEDKWIANALAAMSPMPRSYCNRVLARLAKEKEAETDWEAGWSDFERALKSGPWSHRKTAFALQCELDNVRLQPRL